VDFNKLFSRFAGLVAHATGTPIAFALCLLVVVAWGVTGPLFGFSDTWQLVINTGTTIVTFLMVFLIQNTQNRDGAAIQIKLDELILTSKAENEFIGIEKLTDQELEVLRERCAHAASKTQSLAERAGAELHARRTGGEAPAPKRPPSRKGIVARAKAEAAPPKPKGARKPPTTKRS
jgi:low affinity Fe/Cu permease